jgi:hypothetical protein
MMAVVVNMPFCVCLRVQRYKKKWKMENGKWNFSKKMQKYLRMSKKSRTFAPAFRLYEN